MKRTIICGTALAVMLAGVVVAANDDTDALMALDKEWGSAAQGQAAADTVGRIVSDDVLAISPDGLGSKADMIKAAQDMATPNEPYIADKFEVKHLNENLAVMVHHAGGSEPHWSLHVWQKDGDSWKVVATATAPEAAGE